MKHTRRDVIGAMLAGATALGGIRHVTADTASTLPEASRGSSRSGPLGPSDTVQTVVSERPVAMIIPDAEVDAEVETVQIVDGQMLDPSGPWVVAWYEGTGLLHERERNMLYSGHVDYWDVGPAVFRNLAGMPTGTQITVLGDQGGQAVYAIEYVERVTLAQMTPEKMQEITAPTSYQALTIITCGGEFDYSVGEYLQRDVVRARLVQEEQAAQPTGADQQPAAEATTPETATEQTATVTQDGVNVRPDASTAQDVVAVANNGDTVTITGEPVDAGGFTWYPVELADGTQGFIVAEFLEIAP